jgi:D-alanine-D-alanine ligase
VLLEKRRQTQPIGEWSCGSVFTNPPGDHAARLIETAGLKGFRIGDASVSSEARQFHHQSRCGERRRHRSRDFARAAHRRSDASRLTLQHRSAHRRSSRMSLLTTRSTARRAGDAHDFGKVAVLLGGDSSEREISC